MPGRKLATYVHVVELDSEGAQTGRSGTFGPSDDLPDWVEPAISNPDVWAEGPAVDDFESRAGDDQPPAAPADHPVVDEAELDAPAEPDNVPVPPRSGPGSGTPAWSAYASAQGVTVDDGAGRADIIAALTAAGVPVE